MNIEDIIKEKPHLEDSLRLYEKVVKFTETVLSLSRRGPVWSICYPPELIDPVFEAFSTVFEIPGEILTPLKEAFGTGRFDLTRLPLNEAPFFSLPYPEDELGRILFLIGKPFFRKDGNSGDCGDNLWEKGSCPRCGAKPALASIDSEGRKLYCPCCGATGRFRRLGCPVCLTDETSGINILFAEGDPVFRIDACDHCGFYIKAVTSDVLERLTPELADIVSTPLDMVAQSRGYGRAARNPLGLMRMI